MTTTPYFKQNRLDTQPRGHRLKGFWADPDRTRAWYFLYELALHTDRRAHPFIIKNPKPEQLRWLRLGFFALNRMTKVDRKPLRSHP